MTRSVHVKLAPHPDNPARFHQRVEATLTHTAADGLRIVYAVHGLNLDLRVPTPHAPAPADALWRATCCELFLGAAGRADYREFNFSPSGQWADHDFVDTRQPAPRVQSPRAGPAPALVCARTEDLLRLEVDLAAALLPSRPADGLLRIAVSVILEANDGALGYWALAHPHGKPDFHHHAGFVLGLGAPGFRPTQWP